MSILTEYEHLWFSTGIMASIFAQIISGDIPSHTVYEDEYVFAFLDINGIQLGHTLIVPKLEIDYFVDVPEPYYSQVFKVAKTIAKALDTVTNCKRVGTIIAGWDVPHFHYHLIPMFERSDLDFTKAQRRSDAELASMAAQLRAYLEKNVSSNSIVD